MKNFPHKLQQYHLWMLSPSNWELSGLWYLCWLQYASSFKVGCEAECLHLLVRVAQQRGRTF